MYIISWVVSCIVYLKLIVEEGSCHPSLTLKILNLVSTTLGLGNNSVSFI